MSYKLEKVGVIFAIIIALFLRIDFEIKFLDFYNDKGYQTFAAENIKKGYGCSIVHPDTQDLSQNIIEPIRGYPPFYSYLLSFFSPAFSLVNASIILDILAITILIIALIIIFKALKINLVYQIIFFLYLALTPSPFAYLTSSDLIVTSLFVFNIAVFLLVYKKSYLWFLLIGTIIVFPLLFKYSAYPLIIVIPFVLLLIGFLSKKKEFYIKAGITIINALILIFILKYFLPDYPETKVQERGFFPDQLLKIDDYIFKSFYYIEFFIKNISQSIEWLHILSRIVFISLSLGLFSIVLNDCYTSLKYRNYSNKAVFSFFVAITNIVMIGALSYLSLTIPGETWQDSPWTYVEETRYYGAAMILIQVYFLHYLFNKQETRSLINKTIGAFVISSILFCSIYGFKQIYNIYIKEDYKYTYQENNADLLLIGEIIDSYTKSEEILVYTSHSEYENIFITTHSNIDKFTFLENIIQSNLYSTKAVKLIIHCNKEELEKIKKKKRIKSLRVLQNIKNKYLCILDL